MNTNAKHTPGPQQHKGTMMKTNTCTRCGHKWYPRTPERPRVCPKCKSPYWDKPRKVKGIGYVCT